LKIAQPEVGAYVLLSSIVPMLPKSRHPAPPSPLFPA
jgi:hypothetical protein